MCLRRVGKTSWSLSILENKIMTFLLDFCPSISIQYWPCITYERKWSVDANKNKSYLFLNSVR